MHPSLSAARAASKKAAETTITLYPPLEYQDNTSEDKEKDHRCHKKQDVNKDDKDVPGMKAIERNPSFPKSSQINNPRVMSARLASNFEELKKFAAQNNNINPNNCTTAKKRKTLEDADEEDDSNTNGDDDSSMLSNIRNGDQYAQRLAEETALLAAQEIERMQNAVAELEALLAASASNEINHDIVDNVDGYHNVIIPSSPLTVGRKRNEDSTSNSRSRHAKPRSQQRKLPKFSALPTFVDSDAAGIIAQANCNSMESCGDTDFA